MGRRQESIDTAYHRPVTNNPRKFLSVETPLLRPEFHIIDTGQEHRVRILCSKTTHHLQSVIPTAIRTHNQQSRQINKQAKGWRW